MSTRCTIRIKNESGHIDFYHHSDGYPDGVGFELLELINDFPIIKPYCPDQEPSIDIQMDAFIRALIDDDAGKQYKFDFCTPTDIEYRYELDLMTRTIKCEKVEYELVETIDDEQRWEFIVCEEFDILELYKQYTPKEQH